jgi:putative endonuclease
MNSLSSGKQFEERAVEYLKDLGWKILETNWRSRFGEIDIIARDNNGVVVVVEVRARQTDDFGGATGSVIYAKQQKIIRATKGYLAEQGSEVPTRFDVIAFTGEELEHLVDTFRVD